MSQAALADLRHKIASLEDAGFYDHNPFFLGIPSADGIIGGLARGAIHEIHAVHSAHAAAATGFAVAMAQRVSDGRLIVWARQDCLDAEMGALYAPGMIELGLDPDRLILIRTQDAAGVLRAGYEALCCAALGAVLIEVQGTPKALSLTAGRKLLLAARRSGVTLFMVHVSGDRRPSPAETRWAVEPAPSVALEANAPGHPAFAATLLRHRAGHPVRNWFLEWNRDACSFQERPSIKQKPASAERAAGSSASITPLSRALPSVSADRPAAAEREARRLGGAG